MRRFLIASAIAAGVATAMLAAPAAQSNEALAPAIARQLAGQPAAYALSWEKRERVRRLEENIARQQYYERRGGYGRDYRYGRRYGGPPPWAPAHGYRRHHYERW